MLKLRVSQPVGSVWPVSRVEHVCLQIVLVLSVYELGRVVPGEPAVHALRPAVQPPTLLDHRHRAVLHLQHRGGLHVSLCGKLCQSHFLIQELTYKEKKWGFRLFQVFLEVSKLIFC